jgi:hypothetical protein
MPRKGKDQQPADEPADPRMVVDPAPEPDAAAQVLDEEMTEGEYA